jgi:hypothetical protein
LIEQAGRQAYLDLKACRILNPFPFDLGTDATESFEDIGHSLDAVKLLKKYLVGKVDGQVSDFSI